MSIKINPLPKSCYEVEALISSSEVVSQYDKVLNLLRKDFEMSGFRKGMVPVSLMIDKIGKEKIKSETLELVLKNHIPEILLKTKLIPITNPEVKIEDFDIEKDLTVKIILSVMPEVEISDYDKIKVKKESPKEINDNQVEEMLEQTFKNWQKSKGEILINPSQKPDDAFAKSLGLPSLAELKNKIKEELQKQESFRVEKEFENNLLSKILKETKTEVPETMVEEELNRMIIRLNTEILSLGGSFEDFLKAQGKTVEELRQSWRESAEKNVKIDLALNKIAQLEKIQATEEEITNHLSKNHTNDDSIEKEKNYIRYYLIQSKTLNLLKEKASQ